MLQACVAARDYAEPLGNISELRSDRRTRDAVLHNLFVLGEAAKAVPQDIREKHPEVDWRGMAGLRDIIGHGYFGIDDEILWDVVKTELPGLAEQLRRILDALDRG
jgi:uncharacterized protein with HEPN domain